MRAAPSPAASFFGVLPAELACSIGHSVTPVREDAAGSHTGATTETDEDVGAQMSTYSDPAAIAAYSLADRAAPRCTASHRRIIPADSSPPASRALSIRMLPLLRYVANHELFCHRISNCYSAEHEMFLFLLQFELVREVLIAPAPRAAHALAIAKRCPCELALRQLIGIRKTKKKKYRKMYCSTSGR